MANPTNPIDYATEDLATFLAKPVSDGTYDDIVTTLKSDSPGNAATATQIATAVGQLWGNLIDDFFQASYPWVREVATGNLTGPISITGGDLTLAGNLDMKGAGPYTISFGDTGGGGTGGVEFNKGGASDFVFATWCIGGAGQKVWDMRYTSSEDVEWRVYDGAGVLNGVAMAMFYNASVSSTKIQMQNLEVLNLSQLRGNIASNNASVHVWGDGTEAGSATPTGHQYTKADAGRIITSDWRSGGTADSDRKFGIVFETNEHLSIDLFNSSGVDQGPVLQLRPTDPDDDKRAEVRTMRDAKDLGTGIVPGDFTASAGWGAAASIAATGNDSRGSVSVTASGAGIAANPTITLTFADGAWSVAPHALVIRNDQSTPTPATGYPTWTTTTTTLVVTFNGTPTSGNTYRFDFRNYA